MWENWGTDHMSYQDKTEKRNIVKEKKDKL